MKTFYFSFLSVFFSFGSVAQELNCKVVINAEQIATSEQLIFRDMEKDFAKFMNTRKWTNDTFEEGEEINCNLIVNISEMPSIGRFKATVQILSGRPVYNTDYESVLLNFADRDWTFEYTKSQPFIFNENIFTDNITSLLAYYAYIILGLDYDSFSELGGDTHYERAFNVVNNAKQSNFPGWQQFNSIRNRYWLIENLRSPQLKPIRKALYSYHLKGLDTMVETPDEAKQKILDALSEVSKACRVRPRTILAISFMDAKFNELTRLYSDSDLAMKRQAYNLLVDIDPARSDKYKALIE